MVGQSPGAKPILMLQSMTTSKPTKGPVSQLAVERKLLFTQHDLTDCTTIETSCQHNQLVYTPCQRYHRLPGHSHPYEVSPDENTYKLLSCSSPFAKISPQWDISSHPGRHNSRIYRFSALYPRFHPSPCLRLVISSYYQHR